MVDRDKVFVGSGSRLESEYGLVFLQSMKLRYCSRKSFFQSCYVPDIGRELDPESVFVVGKGNTKYFGHVCGDSNEDKYDYKKAQVLEPPEFAPLREYLTTTEGDRVVVTKSSLVGFVNSIIDGMGYEVIKFA